MKKAEIMKLAEFNSRGMFGDYRPAIHENARLLPLIEALAESCEQMREALESNNQMVMWDKRNKALADCAARMEKLRE